MIVFLLGNLQHLSACNVCGYYVKKDKIDSHFSSSTNKSEWLPFTDTKGRTKKGLRQSLLDRIEEERLVLLRLT